MKRLHLLSLIVTAAISLPACKKEVPAKPTATTAENAPFKEVNLACPGAPTVSGVFTTTGPELEIAGRLSVSPEGKITVYYYFYNLVDFQPGPLSYNIASKTTAPAIARVVYGTNGLVESGKNIGPFKFRYNAPVDTDGNYITAGDESNPGGVANTSYRTFITKYDKNGNGIWKRYLSYCASSRRGEFAASIAFGPDGSVYAATHDNEIKKFSASGTYQGKSFYGEGLVNLYIDNSNNLYLCNNRFVQKISSSGSPLWKTTQYGGNRLTVDSNGNVYIANGSALLTKLNGSGNFVWAIQTTPLSARTGIETRDLALDATGENIYVAGRIEGKMMFNNQQSAIAEANGQNFGAFVVKIKQCL
ncbi:hypothetical protein DJ568_16945 [Mucilaginibacter hurinus]|uniref:Bulb-type lectin domain-containing protein n=1 Tax=Mucilaginibacter hurinus TaxID=2201324 RepID=A0A367GLN7_9SPHI|nr:hypothetical protein [Mucilaginibacter hurinus]RCH53591.1 hypothetical protein DJ568_16945 [Mucilaginibacter hurinus]